MVPSVLFYIIKPKVGWRRFQKCFQVDYNLDFDEDSIYKLENHQYQNFPK